jgi:hypothetical protein
MELFSGEPAVKRRDGGLASEVGPRTAREISEDEEWFPDVGGAVVKGWGNYR